MAVTAPSEFPEWADGGSALVTEPPITKKQQGFNPGEKPAPQFLNWWMLLVFNWIKYLFATTSGFAFGNGSDGDVTLDGTVTVPWATLAAGVYSLTRDTALGSLTINAGI